MTHVPDGTDNAGKARALRGLVGAAAFDVAVTLTAAALSTSAVVLADFLKTFVELVAILLSWLAMRRIARGADHTFEYGMGKLESFSSLLVGLAMLVSFLVISANAAIKVMHPSHIEGVGVWISAGTEAFFLVVNGTFLIKTYRLSRGSDSPLLAAQTRLLLTRFAGNIFILGAVGSSLALKTHHWALYIDPAASILIAASILSATLGLFATSVTDLLDRTLEEERQLVIMREVARCFHDFDELHGIRSRRSGSRVYVEIFLEFSPDKTAAEVHRVAGELRRSLEHAIPNSCVTVALATEPVR